MGFIQRASIFAVSALFLMACGKEGQAPIGDLAPEAPPMQPQASDPYANGGQGGMNAPMGMQPGMNGPGGMQPGMNAPMGMQPGMNGPGGMQPGMNMPMGMQPGMNGPGGMQPGMNMPMGMQPGMNGPGGMQGGMNMPMGMQPGMNGPGGMQPGMNPPGPQGGPGMGGPGFPGYPQNPSPQFREAYQFFSNVQVSQQKTVRPLFNGRVAVRIATQVVSQRGFRMDIFRANYNRCIQNGMPQVQAIQQAFYEMNVHINVQEYIL